MKSILLIGLGRFGQHMAKKLSSLHHQVLAVDRDERKVQDAMEYVTSAEIGDATDDAVIDALGVGDFDVCVVAVGNDLQASLEISALLKKKGARFVVARVSQDVHAQFLLACGADEVIYPERQVAEWAAVRYSSEHIFDYIRLSRDHAIYETDIPEQWVGRSVMDLAIRQKYHLNILAVRRNGEVDPMPGASYVFSRGERIILLGSESDVQKFVRF